MVMKPILFGAVLGLLWLVAGVPLTPALVVLAAVVQPVTIAFVLGVGVRSYGRRSRRWTV